MKKSSVLLALIIALFFGFGQSFAQNASAGGSAISTPFFLGGALGFGSGTGVGNERGIGLRQIEPMIGLWYPGMGFLRVGYGFFEFEEDDGDGNDYDVEHSNFDVELGVHVLGSFYLVGNYSRSKELSDQGDASWNEWGVGFGSILSMFGKTQLFSDVSYRWVLDHYDATAEKNVSGSRLQFNLGFAAYLF